MKKLSLILSSIMILIFLAGCSGDEIRKSPVGSYSFGSTSFELTRQGVFHLEHTSSSEDSRNYLVDGTYTYTLDTIDEENEITIGKIDVTVTGLTLNGSPVNSLDVTVYQKRDIWVGSKLLGWWKYMNLVSYGGKMNLDFNSPYTGLRPEDANSGSQWLIVGDPK
ncbi:MAG: hypothetical protein A2Z74_02185 [Chloroflexi bacterium RBG_13_46_9]|nr:MAG: hypothetical protein A2Z74_02185 [Chloroflexi bacterium RBG_13_46_9]